MPPKCWKERSAEKGQGRLQRIGEIFALVLNGWEASDAPKNVEDPAGEGEGYLEDGEMIHKERELRIGH